MSKLELFRQLNDEREIVVSPHAGERAKELAWERIDMLLDCLAALNVLDSECVLVPEVFEDA